MLNKKGQITIFIIVGIFVLIAFALIFYLISIGKSPDIKKVQSLEPDVLPIRNYVESCLYEVSAEAIDYIGNHGGYYNLNDVYSTDSPPYYTAYYFYSGDYLVPTRERVAKEISDYIDDNLFFCLQNFIIFKERGFDIEMGIIKSSVSLAEENANIILNMPLSMKRDAQESKLSGFAAIVETKLGNMLDVASRLTVEQVNDPNNICISCIFREGISNTLLIELSNIDNSTVIFTILDTNKNQQLVYANNYAVYSCNNPPHGADYSFFEDCISQRLAALDYDFFVGDIPDMNVTVNETFYYEINASGLNLSFYDFTSIFDVGIETGIIEFTPIERDIGNHTIWIMVEDNVRNQEFKSLRLRVLNMQNDIE